MTELFLRLALDQTELEMGRALRGEDRRDPHDESDPRHHHARMRRLSNWSGTVLGNNTRPVPRRIERRPATA